MEERRKEGNRGVKELKRRGIDSTCRTKGRVNCRKETGRRERIVEKRRGLC